MLSVLVFHLLGPLQISAMAVVVGFTAYRLHLTSSVFCLYHLFLFRVSLEATSSPKSYGVKYGGVNASGANVNK